MEGLSSFSGPINEGIQDDKVTRCIIITEASATGSSKDMGASDQLQCPQIGPVVDLGRVKLVPLTMPKSKVYLVDASIHCIYITAKAKHGR